MRLLFQENYLMYGKYILLKNVVIIKSLHFKKMIIIWFPLQKLIKTFFE